MAHITISSPEFLAYWAEYRNDWETIERAFEIFIHDECFTCEHSGKSYVWADRDQDIQERFDELVAEENADDWLEGLEYSDPREHHLTAYDLLPRSVFA